MLDNILEQYDDEEIIIAKGLDKAVIGIATPILEPRLIYSVSKCLEFLRSDFPEMEDEEVLDHFNYNVAGGGTANTPIWCWDNFEC